MASALSYSSFMPAGLGKKSGDYSVYYSNRPNLLQGLFRMQNLRFAYFLNADSLISCAAHKK
jgi:hypothetical protein